MITQLIIRNFRRFDRHKVPLRPMTTLVSKNNAGKSTVVETKRDRKLLAGGLGHSTNNRQGRCTGNLAADFFEEDRKIGFPGANKKALERLEAVWKTREGRISGISGVCGKDVLHKLFDWVSSRFKVSLSALKLAKEI